jgi:hypothetical protein
MANKRKATGAQVAHDVSKKKRVEDADAQPAASTRQEAAQMDTSVDHSIYLSKESGLARADIAANGAAVSAGTSNARNDFNSTSIPGTSAVALSSGARASGASEYSAIVGGRKTSLRAERAMVEVQSAQERSLLAAV